MKWKKFILFVIAIFSITVVVFNNLNQVIQQLFIPKTNIKMLISFCVAVFGVVIYFVANKDMLKR